MYYEYALPASAGHSHHLRKIYTHSQPHQLSKIYTHNLSLVNLQNNLSLSMFMQIFIHMCVLHQATDVIYT